MFYRLFFALTFCFFSVCSASHDHVEDTESSKVLALKTLPMQDEMFDQPTLSGAFGGVVRPEVAPLFTDFLAVLFAEGFPAPKHSALAINKGWQCLYAKFVDAQTVDDQKEALFKLMALHTQVLPITLRDQIPEDTLPCDSCKNSARLDLGLDPAPAPAK